MNKQELLLAVIDLFLKPFTRSFFKKIKDNQLVQRTITLYPNSKFIKIRFWDAPFLEVEKIVPRKGIIVDLGCGEGVFTNFLAISSPLRKILGIEIDRNRINLADHKLDNVSLKLSDATKSHIPNADVIILFHLLHHLQSKNDQEKVLKSCTSSLKPKGKLIIVEVEPKFSLKYLITWMTDHFIVPWIFEKKFYSPIFFRKSNEWLKLLKEDGLSCKVINADQDKPFSHIIFDCQFSPVQL